MRLQLATNSVFTPRSKGLFICRCHLHYRSTKQKENDFKTYCTGVQRNSGTRSLQSCRIADPLFCRQDPRWSRIDFDTKALRQQFDGGRCCKPRATRSTLGDPYAWRLRRGLPYSSRPSQRRRLIAEEQRRYEWTCNRWIDCYFSKLICVFHFILKNP